MEAAAEPDRNGLTAAGRALQKHSSRRGSAFKAPEETTVRAFNMAGQSVVEDILDDPAGRVIMSYSGTLREFVYDILAADGRAVRYTADGKMVGLREP